MSVDQFVGAAGQAATQFVISQEKIGLLLGTGGKTFKRIGSLFKVHIHLTSGHHQSGEWVSIYGKEDDRARAKEYIMSMCNPTVEEKIPYSADLHEHLVGKGGKTHRYLESNSSAVITFSTACTAPNEHTAHIRGSKDSVAYATNLVREIMRKTQKRRQKENQPPTEDVDKELLQVLKADNKLALWETLKNETDNAKRSYLLHLKSLRHKVSSSEGSPGSSSEGGLEDSISSHAELLAYAKKLHLSEEDASKVLNQTGITGINKNGFLANLIQYQRDNELKKTTQEHPGLGHLVGAAGTSYNAHHGDVFHSGPYHHSASQEFHSYPGLVSDCATDFRLEQPGSAFDNMPLGLTARSIAPLLQQQQRLDHGMPPNEFSSAPAGSHYPGSRYAPDNTLTLEQLLAQPGSYGSGLGSKHHVTSPNQAGTQMHQPAQQLQTNGLAQQLPTNGLAQQLPTNGLAQQLSSNALSSNALSQQQESQLLIQLLLKDERQQQQQQQQQQQREIQLLLRHRQQLAQQQLKLQQQQSLEELVMYQRRLQEQQQQPAAYYAAQQAQQAAGGQIGAAIKQHSLSPVHQAPAYEHFPRHITDSYLEGKLSLDFLHETESTDLKPYTGDQVADILKHLNF